ncbi:MAG: aldo/keto reductase [Bacteroidetes bacterium]|nr:aldo/keto reductase [Bacteroidota bacterium]
MSLKYSKIIAGAMTWGCWGKQLNTEEMTRLIYNFIENDITTFDHADIYGDYSTETEFGNALAKCDIKRSDIQIISKCGIQYLGSSRTNKIKHYNYSKDYIIWSVEKSLKHFKTDYLDAILLHRPSPLMHPYEIMEAIAKLAQEGKIKDFGVSNFTPSQVELISSQVPITINQIEFSITNHNAMYDGVLDQMIVKNIIPMAWSPLGNVFKESTKITKRIHVQLEALQTKYNATKDQLLLAWILNHPAGIHPVIGTTNQDRIKNAHNALGINLEIEDWFFILKACQGHKVP